MSRNGLLAGAAICLSLGLVDLAVLDLWLAPAAFAPTEPPGAMPGSPWPSASSTREDRSRATTKREKVEPAPAPTAPPAPPAAPPVEAPPSPPAPTPQPSAAGKTTIYFGTGQSTLSPEATEALRREAAKLLATPQMLIIIEGHADQRGEADRNNQLSLLRAGTVAAFLKEQGLEAGRIRVRGLGSARPVDQRNTPEAWARNRRVDVRTRMGHQ